MIHKTVAILLCITTTLNLLAQNNPTTNSEFKPTITFRAMMQARFESSLTDSIDVASGKISSSAVRDNFRLRRAELRSDIKLNDHWSGVIRVQIPELKVSPASITTGRTLELAYFQYEYNDKFGIRGGHMRMPYELDELTYADELRMIDRGTTNKLFAGNSLVSYQPGLMVYGTFMKNKTPLSYYAGIFNASDRSLPYDVNSGKNVIGRLEFTPVKGLRLAGNVEYVAVIKNNNGASYGGDVSYIRDITQKLNLTLEGEYIAAPNVNQFNAATDSLKTLNNFPMTGYFGQALLKIKSNSKWSRIFEAGGKYEHTDPLTNVSGNLSQAFHTITGEIGFDFLTNNMARLQLNVIRTIYEQQSLTQTNNTFFVTQMQLKIGG
ncbi:MAG: porin [Chitinophagales bacterium]